MIRQDTSLPLARKDNLESTDIFDEVLVYDLKTHRVFHLNKTAALVWRHCDGKTRSSELLVVMREELGIPPDARLIELSLKKFEEAGLLSHKGTSPRIQYSRRQLARTLCLSLALIPLVAAVMAPSPAQAASCVGIGGLCGHNFDCCPGLQCNNSICI